MATSQDILNQLREYQSGDIPGQIETEIKKAYEGPVSTLISEGQDLRNQYYPQFFKAAQDYGTGASDMSPAARLQAMVGSAESLGNTYRTNLGLRDYYNTDINSLVGKGISAYQTGQQNLQNQYQLQYQREQDELARQMQEKQLAAQRAASAAARMYNPKPTYGATPANPIQTALDQAKAGGESNLYKTLRQVEAQYGGWDNLSPTQQALISPYWGEWQAQKYGEWARSMPWNKVQEYVSRGGGYTG